MKTAGLVIILLVTFPVFAQTVQVPESCINQKSPCLIHTSANTFDFIYDGQKITMFKDSIIKISFDDKKSNLELMDGRITLRKQKKNQKLLSINNWPVHTGWMMLSHSSHSLKILDLNDFNMSEYQAAVPGVVEPKLLKTDFIDKIDFIKFTKYYFHNIGEYKKFLAKQSPNWKREFQKQNNSQTKVLMRTIASEQRKAKIEAEKNAVQANQSKKTRQFFFYRTFER